MKELLKIVIVAYLVFDLIFLAFLAMEIIFKAKQTAVFCFADQLTIIILGKVISKSVLDLWCHWKEDGFLEL